MTKHAHSLPGPEEERIALDAFYGRVARTVVLLLVAAGLCAFVFLVLAPAAFRALGGGIGALLVVKTAGALLLGGLLTPVLTRTAFGGRDRLGLTFVYLAMLAFGGILMRPTRDAGLEWLNQIAGVSVPFAFVALVLLRKRSRTAKDKEQKAL